MSQGTTRIAETFDTDRMFREIKTLKRNIWESVVPSLLEIPMFSSYG